MMRFLILLFGTFLATILPAHGQPIADPAGAGLKIIVTTDQPVIATYLGTSASFSDDLFLGDTLIFNNQTTLVGTTFNLGTFAIGTELIFRLAVNNTGDNWFSGPSSRNDDGLAHAAVQSDYLVPGTTLVSFEDLRAVPPEYNDLSFSFTGTAGAPVPEPATWAMMILGFALVGLGLRRHRLGGLPSPVRA